MKHVAVIGGMSYESADQEELAAFCAGLQRAEAAIYTIIYLDQLQIDISPQAFIIRDALSNTDFAQFDLLILRSKMRTNAGLAHCISTYAHVHGVPFFNDYSGYFSGTKLSQATIFYELGMPFLRTIYAKDHQALMAAVQRSLVFPCILKDSGGAKGASNYLIRDSDALRSALAAEPDVAFIAQEYCPSDRDYRVLIVGHKHLVIKRTSQNGSHLHNTSTGGRAELTPNDIHEPILQQSKRVAEAMGLTIAGVDVMPRLGTDQFYFLEVNSQPQLFTGTFIEAKLPLMAEILKQKLASTDS